MIMQGSVAKLMQCAMTDLMERLTTGTYEAWTLSEFKSYPLHTQYRELKFYEVHDFLPIETINQYRKDLGLIGYVEPTESYATGIAQKEIN